MARRPLQHAAAACLAALALSSAACIGDKIREEIAERQEENANMEQIACRRMQDGPAASLTGGTAAADAPAVAADDTRYDVALVDAGGPRQGVVTFEAAEPGRYVVYLADNVSLTVADPAGAALPPVMEVEGSSECTEIVASYEFAMEAGAHTLTFGPTNAAEVSLVVAQIVPEEG